MDKHPSEYYNEDMRSKNDVFRTINDNEVLLMNLPHTITKEALRELAEAKNLLIQKISIFPALDFKKVSYAKI